MKNSDERAYGFLSKKVIRAYVNGSRDNMTWPNRTIAELVDHIEELEKKVDEQDNEIKGLQTDIRGDEEEIEMLETEVKRLEGECSDHHYIMDIRRKETEQPQNYDIILELRDKLAAEKADNGKHMKCLVEVLLELSIAYMKCSDLGKANDDLNNRMAGIRECLDKLKLG